MAGQFARQLLADFDADLETGSRLASRRFVELVRSDRATPKNTGALGDGIEADRPTVGRGVVSVEIRSTATTDAGADYGTILDRSTGRTVEAASYGHRAFGPITPPLSGGRQFIRSFRVTTKHVGWWDKSTRIELARRASDEFGKVDL